jgi:hypothetical protein
MDQWLLGKWKQLSCLCFDITAVGIIIIILTITIITTIIITTTITTITIITTTTITTIIITTTIISMKTNLSILEYFRAELSNL